MERLKRMACALLACFAAVGALPACGDAGGDVVEAPVTITWYMPGNPTGMTADAFDAVMAELNQYLVEKVNARLDLKLFSFTEYGQKCSAVISSGEAFDLMFTSDWINPFATNAGSSAYLPLNDYLQACAPGILADTSEEIWKAMTINGQVYAMPSRQNQAKNDGFFLRADIAEALDVTPSSYDNGVGVYAREDVEALYEQIMAYDPEIVPDDSGGIPWVYMDEALGFNMLAGFSVPGAVRLSDEAVVINQFATDEFMEYCRMVRSWQEKGYLHEDMAVYATLGHQVAIDRQSDKHVTYRAGYAAPNVAAMAMAVCGWDEVPVPIISSDKYITTASVTQSLTAVGVNSRYPEKAIELYNLFYTDESVANTLLYGIEGTHYTKISDTEVEIIRDGGYVNPIDNYTVGNQFITWVEYGYYPSDIWEQVKAFSEDSYISALLGFTFDSRSVRNQVANCSAIYDEYKYALLCGAVDPETTVPQMLGRLQLAGCDDIIREMQRQVDAFLAG